MIIILSSKHVSYLTYLSYLATQGGECLYSNSSQPIKPQSIIFLIYNGYFTTLYVRDSEFKPSSRH